MENPFEYKISVAPNETEKEIFQNYATTERRAEKTAPFDLKFYVTDHSADNANTNNPETLRNLYDDIKTDGISSVRYDWRWNKIESEKGEFQMEVLGRYENAIELMDDAGLESTTLVFSNIPQWALDLYQKDKPLFFESYRNYVEKVKEYLIIAREKTGKSVSMVQVLNELNNLVYTPIDGDSVTQLCHITREVLREYNPDLNLLAPAFAGNLPQVAKDVSFGKINFGTPIDEYLEKSKDVLDNFDVIAIDYYPGMWHIPLQEALENKKEIFKQLELLKQTMETIAA